MVAKNFCDICRGEINVFDASPQEQFTHWHLQYFTDNGLKGRRMELCKDCAVKVTDFIEHLKKDIEMFGRDFRFSRNCINLRGFECPGANASECLARLNSSDCPTFSAEELREIIGEKKVHEKVQDEG